MQSIAPLIDYFEKIIPLSQEEKELVNELFKHRLYRKRQFVLQEGDVCKYFNFVVRGCLRMYKIDDKGNYNTLQFAIENQFITDVASFYNQENSALEIEVLENAEILQISHSDLLKLYDFSPKFERIFRIISDQNTMFLQKHLSQVLGMPSGERYLYFEREYPQLVGRLSQVQIAGFLGITSECFSRIKSHIKNS